MVVVVWRTFSSVFDSDVEVCEAAKKFCRSSRGFTYIFINFVKSVSAGVTTLDDLRAPILHDPILSESRHSFES